MIDLKETNYGMLRERFDKDMTLLYLEKFVLKNPEDNTKPMPNSVSLTLNDPRTFGDRCMAILSADKKIFDITGVDPTKQKELEAAYKHWLYVNDEQLEAKQVEPLEDCINFFDLFRGWIGGLVLMYQDGDKFLPSIVPVDPRWMTWEVGDRGLKQFSYNIRMDKVEAEEKFKRKFTTNNNRPVELQCIWDDKNYYVGVVNPGQGTKTDVFDTKPHNLDICPGVIVPVPTQPMLISGSEDYPTSLSRQGESIYAPNRDVYPTINLVASILASIMQEAYISSVVYKGRKEGFDQNPAGGGKYVQIDPTEEIVLWPVRDLNRATEYLFGILGSGKQRGSLSDINYGQISFELSALAVAQLKDDRDGIFVPRRKAKKTFYRRAFNVLRYQVLHGGYKTDIDAEDAIEIEKGIFEKKCVVNIDFNSVSPEENISNFTIANQAQAIGLPLSKIYRNILHDDDPEGTLREAKLERAYKTVPLLELYDMAIAAAPGNLSEDEMNQDRALILIDSIEKMMQQQTAQTEQMVAGGLNAVPNIASQPKNTTKLNRSSSEKMAQAKLKESGLTNAQNARREGNIGG